MLIKLNERGLINEINCLLLVVSRHTNSFNGPDFGISISTTTTSLCRNNDDVTLNKPVKVVLVKTDYPE